MAGTDDTFPAADERALAQRGAGLVAEAVAQVDAPPELHERIALQRGRAIGRRRRRTAFSAGFAAACAVLALVLALPGSDADGPSLVVAAKLGELPPLEPSAVDPSNPDLLTVQHAGIRFPEWKKLKWPAVGTRTDRVEGRDTMTVFYTSPRGALAAYTIVGGAPLTVPVSATRHRMNGMRFAVLRRGERKIVTWRQDGHTCILSSPAAVPTERLLKLAAWRAEAA